MSSSQIQVLLAAPDLIQADRVATETLNAQFQSLEDLDQLESLVLQAKQSYDELIPKLSSSQSYLDALLSNTRSSAEEHLRTAKELAILRHSLADELSELSSDLVSSMSGERGQPTLLEDLETLHRNLKELESVKGYVQVVEHALKLSEVAIRDLESASVLTTASITGYISLQDFVAKVSTTCSKVEVENGNQNLHLVTFLNHLRDKTWVDMKAILSKSLISAAENIGWPMPIDYAFVAPQSRKEFEAAFLKLTKLQSIGKNIHNAQLEEGGLYPFQALVQPLSLRFKYHFQGTRQTNRLEKPEWYFTHILNVVHEQRQFLESTIQSLLAATEYKEITAWREFTYLLLPILSQKLKKTVPLLLSRPSLLAHTIYQAISFDASMVEEGFHLGGTSALKPDTDAAKWDGIGEVILGNPEWFEAWLTAEKQFAEDQYHDIVNAPDAWFIAEEDDDVALAHNVKATNSSRRVRSLVDQVTDRFSPLPHVLQRTYFLTSIQLPLLEAYRLRISSSLEAFETSSSAFVRAVPGALAVSLTRREDSTHDESQRLTSGVEGVQRLCKALLSAAYIEASLQDWAQELFFLELWADICRNSLLRSRSGSNSLLPNPSPLGADEIPQETLFEEIMSRYQKTILRATEMVIQQVCGEIESYLKAHFVSSITETDDGSGDEISLSQTLLGPLALLSSHLTFLRTTLPQSMFTTLYRRIATRLAEHILHRQNLYRGQFDLTEGKIICAECELWVETCHTAVRGSLGGGRRRVEAPWFKLLQAGRLVGADGDSWTTLVNATFGTQTNAEWERVMLETLGLTELAREDAGQILRRRTDCHA